MKISNKLILLLQITLVLFGIEYSLINNGRPGVEGRSTLWWDEYRIRFRVRIRVSVVVNLPYE